MAKKPTRARAPLTPATRRELAEAQKLAGKLIREIVERTPKSPNPAEVDCAIALADIVGRDQSREHSIDRRHARPRRGMVKGDFRRNPEIDRIILESLRGCADTGSAPAHELVQLIAYRLTGVPDLTEAIFRRMPKGEYKLLGDPSYLLAAFYQRQNPLAKATEIAEYAGRDPKTVREWMRSKGWPSPARL